MVSLTPSSIHPLGEALVLRAEKVRRSRETRGGWLVDDVAVPGDIGEGLSLVKTRYVASLICSVRQRRSSGSAVSVSTRTRNISPRARLIKTTSQQRRKRSLFIGSQTRAASALPLKVA